MRAPADRVGSIRERATEILGGQSEVQEWEIAVLHRVCPAEPGACTRVIWGKADTTRMEQVADAVRMTLLSRMEDLPGFCSVSLLMDRQNGRTAAAVTYESRDAMTQATPQAKALREEFSQQVGMEITEVAEFDLVLAHLRVPETV